MKRKVIQLAHNTLVVSLPANWVKKTGLCKGDDVSIEEVGHALLVSSLETDSEKRFLIDIDKIGFDKNMISYLYQKGFDSIEIVGMTKSIFDDVKDRVSDLLGYEVIEHSEKRCVIRSVSKAMESEFDNLLRRTFLITIEMGRAISESIRNGQHDRFQEIRSLEKTTNTFTDFCKRILSKGGYKDPANTVYVYTVVRDLEKIADCYKYICDIFLDGAPAISKDVLALFDRTNRLVESFHKLYYRFDSDGLDLFRKEAKSIIGSAKMVQKDCSHQESLMINDILMMTTLAYDLIGPYFSQRFDG